jgi:hypothetical protein
MRTTVMWVAGERSSHGPLAGRGLERPEMRPLRSSTGLAPAFEIACCRRGADTKRTGQLARPVILRPPFARARP